MAAEAASSSTALPPSAAGYMARANAQLAALNQQRDALIEQQAQAQANMDAAMEHAQEQQALPLVVDDDAATASVTRTRP